MSIAGPSVGARLSRRDPFALSLSKGSAHSDRGLASTSSEPESFSGVPEQRAKTRLI
jgi:hypothetical protein